MKNNKVEFHQSFVSNNNFTATKSHGVWQIACWDNKEGEWIMLGYINEKENSMNFGMSDIKADQLNSFIMILKQIKSVI